MRADMICTGISWRNRQRRDVCNWDLPDVQNVLLRVLSAEFFAAFFRNFIHGPAAVLKNASRARVS